MRDEIRSWGVLTHIFILKYFEMPLAENHRFEGMLG